MKLWRREPTPEEELDDRRAAAAVTLQRWTRGIKWRKTHAKDVRALEELRGFQQPTRARGAALVEVTPLRRSAGLVASAVGAAAGFALGDASIGAATAASVAAFTERQGENERHKQTQQLTASLQRDAINQDRLLHRDSLRADQELHRRSIHVDKVLHLKTILTDLLEADKEADRDLLCGNQPSGHAIEQASRRWRGGHDSAVAETRRDNLIHALAITEREVRHE